MIDGSMSDSSGGSGSGSGSGGRNGLSGLTFYSITCIVNISIIIIVMK